jgi:prophage regulatory protein
MSEQTSSPNLVRLQRALVTLQQVREITGMSRTWVYAASKEGRFPKPIRLGSKSIRWLAEDIDRWIEERRQAVNA